MFYVLDVEIIETPLCRMCSYLMQAVTEDDEGDVEEEEEEALEDGDDEDDEPVSLCNIKRLIPCTLVV